MAFPCCKCCEHFDDELGDDGLPRDGHDIPCHNGCNDGEASDGE
jgi:hypothetical protein